MRLGDEFSDSTGSAFPRRRRSCSLLDLPSRLCTKKVAFWTHGDEGQGYSYSSALVSPLPPAMSTSPLGNRVAVCSTLPTAMLLVAAKVPALGS